MFVFLPRLQKKKRESKHCVYPKEHSTVEKELWKTNGGEILFRV